VVKDLAAADSHNKRVSSYVIKGPYGWEYHRLTPEWIRLLSKGVIGMMVIYNIQSWRLCYIAGHHLLFKSIASDIRKHNLVVVVST